MNRISMTIRSIIGLTLSILISIITIIVVTIGIMSLSKNDHKVLEVVIGSVGNISGGIIGGVVAYIVASYQAKKTSDEQDKLLLRSAYSYLRILREEINHNEFLFGQATQTPSEDFGLFKPVFAAKISNLRWEQLATQIGPEIDEALFKTLYRYYNGITVLRDKNMVTMELILQISNIGSQLLPELDQKLETLSQRLNAL